ncbi:MAG: DUF3177 family protein [Prochlorococcaceae cyanobacterium]
MSDLLYRSLVWLDYRLAVLFFVAMPLVLLVWSSLRREGALVRLLLLYWKTASLLAITVLLLSDGRPLGYLLGVVAQLLIVATLWFWVDLNEELADLPPWRPLPLTMRLWRWAVTLLGLLGALISATALGCLGASLQTTVCQVWQEAPRALLGWFDLVFGFLFGGNWTPSLSAFVGYLGLVAYGVGLLQWLLVRLPRQGRVAGGF